MKVTEIEAIDEDGKEIVISVAMFSNKDYKTLRRKESMAVSQTSYGLMIAIDGSQEKDMIEILKQMGLKTNVLG
jgi:pentose-5-phosphate-3-epimerase